MNSSKKYCLFPKPQLKHLLFLFYFISSIVKQYIFKDMKEDDNLSIPIFKLYIYIIGDLLSLIPYLIIKYKTKSNKSVDSNKRYFNLIHTNIFKKMRKQIIKNIFIISLLDFIAQISTIIFYLIEENQKMIVSQANLNIILIFNIIFLFILTKFILDIAFYLHHYFSIIISIICLIVIVIIDLLAINKIITDKYTDLNERNTAFINSALYIAIKIFAELLFSIAIVISKVLYLKYYISPYFLLLVKAIIQIFFAIIFSIPLIFVKFKDKIIFSMFKDIFDIRINILLYIVYCINSCIYNILDGLIVDKFSPTHSTIAYIFENLGIFIINAAAKVIIIDYQFGIRLVMYILLIFASFIYNEVLVINICGLANGTKLFLEDKEKNDLNLIGEIIDENDCSSEVINEDNIRTTLTENIINNIELNDI